MKLPRSWYVSYDFRENGTWLVGVDAYVVEAPNERAARRRVREYLSARFFGGGWRIGYVRLRTDNEKE